jgi:DNA mismatch repair protein MutL
VHPTKQEIKFEDEKIVYAFVQAAVKHALAQFSIAPSLDFTLNADIQGLDAINKPFTNNEQNNAASSNLFKTFSQRNQAHAIEPTNKNELKSWKEFFSSPQTPKRGFEAPHNNDNSFEYEKPFQSLVTSNQQPATSGQQLATHQSPYTIQHCLQLHNTYIIAATQNGFVLVHQQLAHERILYEKYSVAAHGTQMATQKSMFPVSLELVPSDAALLQDILPELQMIGYLIEPFGNNTFVIQGTPADVMQGNEKHSLELLIEQFKHFSSDIKFSKREKLVRCMARQQAIKSGQPLQQQEMVALVEELFTCNTPNVTPTGSPTYVEFKEDYLDRMFQRL